MRRASACAVLAIAAALPLLPSTGAGATRNGLIAYAWATFDDGDPALVGNQTGISVVSSRGGTSRVLYSCTRPHADPWDGPCPRGGFGVPSWSPDGRRLVFAANCRLVVLDSRSGALRRLPRAGCDSDPVFSPDGRRLLFTRATDHDYQLWIADQSGRSARPLPVGTDVGRSTWARQTILFQRRGLWTVRPDGTRLRRIKRGDGYWPALSPAGGRVVYGTLDGIETMLLADRRAHELVWLRGSSQPRWSPDGRQLLVTDYGPGLAIAVAATDGTRARVVVRPRWGPRFSTRIDGAAWQPLPR